MLKSSVHSLIEFFFFFYIELPKLLVYFGD